MQARSEKLEGYSKTAITVESAAANFASVPSDVIIKHIIAVLIAADIDAAINLSFVCKKLLFLSEQPLANALSQCLYDADQSVPDAREKLMTAIKLTSRKPFLMFVKPEKNKHTGVDICALSYAASSIDIYVLGVFRDIARASNLLKDWLDVVQKPVAKIQAAEVYSKEVIESYKCFDLPDNTLLPLFNAYLKTLLAFTTVSENFKKSQNAAAYYAETDAARKLTKTLIGGEQRKLKRWLKEEFFRAPRESYDDAEFNETKPCSNWIAEDINVGLYEKGKIWGIDFAVYRSLEDEPCIEASELVDETCNNNFAMLSRLFKTRTATLHSMIDSVQVELGRKKSQ